MCNKYYKRTIALFMCSIWLATFTGAVPAEEFVSLDMFHIKRNKNSNLVQYSVYVNKQSCQPKKSEPAHVYWRNLEVSPTDVSDLMPWEWPAYDIDSQAIKGDELHIRLEALPERLITIDFVKEENGCKATPRLSINKEKGVLEEVYVFAKERKFWLPKVKWIEIRGSNPQGIPVKERINVD